VTLNSTFTVKKIDKMKLFVIIALFVCVVAADDECSRGESYWCSDIRVAKQCGAIKHCTDTVWKNTVVTKDQTDVCQFCKAIVLDVRNLLTDKKTQQEIQKYLESACTVIPDSQIAASCKDIVDNYLPEVLMLVETFSDPETICNALGICSGFRDRATHVEHIPVGSEPICGDCKKFIGDIRALITDKTTEDQVKDLLKTQLCSVLGLIADQCKQLVDEYTPELLKLLADQVEPEVICGALGVCDGHRGLLAAMRMKNSPLYREASKVSSEASCLACKTILTDLQVVVRDPTVQADLENFFLNNLCTKLGTLKQSCIDSVKLYSRTIFELIVSEMDPDERCKAFGFCSSAASDNNIPLVHVPLTKTTNVKVMAGQSNAPSPQCVLCEFVVKELDSLLSSNATEEEILAALDKVCSIMPDTIKQQCLDFVNTYGPAIIELLKQELDPSEVCTALGLCSQMSVAVHPMPMLLLAKPKSSDAETCAVCETVMAYVASMLKENATEEEIQQLLDKVCNFLPKNLQQECLDLMNQYGKQIIDMIIKSASPKEICTMLGLCSTKQPISAGDKKATRPLLGAKPCTRGPGYWCNSMDTATECKMVDYCKRTVWMQK